MMVRMVSVKVPEAQIDGLAKLIEQGVYPSRSAAIRVAIRDLLKNELWGIERNSEMLAV